MNTTMVEQIRGLLLTDRSRFLAKGLFGQEGDTFSMRVPGLQELLLVRNGADKPERVALGAPSDDVAGLHARLYRTRPDTGAVLIGGTPWSEALSLIGLAFPALFDEQARHIGQVRTPVGGDDVDGLEKAIADGANIAIFGTQRVCLGVTPERIVFNAELFEKCAKAFVIAHYSGRDVRRIPWWVRAIAGSRLKKDQGRAAESLAAGRIPEGMNAY